MNMKIVWKEILASVALSAMALSMIGTNAAVARPKSAVIKSCPVYPEYCSTDKTTQTPPTDPVAPPPVDDGAAPPSTEYEAKGGGQHLEKPPRDPVTVREATPPPVDDGAAPPSVEKGKSAWIEPKGTVLQDIGLKRTKSPKPGKTSFLLPVVGGVAALAALVAAAGGGNDSPTSP
jgi:hypothetical protein